MFLRILNWIGSAQVIVHGGLLFCVGRDCFVVKVMPVKWMSKAMKGDVSGYFMTVCFHPRKGCSSDRGVGPGEEYRLEHRQGIVFSNERNVINKTCQGRRNANYEISETYACCFAFTQNPVEN